MRTLLLPGMLAVLLLGGCGGTKPAAKPSPPETTGTPAEGGDRGRRSEVMRLFMEATQARLAGRGGQAIQLYLRCLKLDPRNAAAMFELGKLYHQAGDRAQAVDFAKRAAATDKDNIWFRFLLADLYRDNGQLEEAIGVYRGIIAQWPERYETHFDLANTLAYTGKVNEAIKVYAAMEQRFGLNEEIIMRQFGMLAASGRMDEAEKLAHRAIAAHPGEPRYQGILAELYDQRGEREKALEHHLKALELDPGNSLLRIALAEHYYATGKHDLAYDELGTAFQDPDLDLDAKMQVLVGFFEMTHHEGKDPEDRPRMVRRSYELIDVLEKAHPESGKPHTIHGDFLLRDGDFEQAREQFRLALRHEKDRYPIWLQVMQLDLQLGDFDGLHNDAEEAISLFPTIPENHLYNGIALSQLGRHEAAIETLIVGRDLVVDNPPLLAQFWSSLGDAHNEARQFEKSDRAFDKALALEPDNPTTLNNHAYYLSERNDQLEKAERMSKRSNELAPGQPSFLDTYAWVLFRMGRYADARTWIEKAVAAGGQDQGVIVEHHGDILFKLGDTAGAVERWRKAKELGGGSDALDRKINEGVWSE